MPSLIDEGQLGPWVDSWPACIPSSRTLDGRFVSLCALNPSAHAPSLYEGSHGDGADLLWRYLTDGPFEDSASFRASLEAKVAATDRVYFAIVDKKSGDAVGSASYLRMDPSSRVIEVGSILYTRRLQRTPGGTEAMYLMARHAFEQLGYRRYEWECDALNAASCRAAHRLGFTFEGIFRQHKIVKERSRDTAWFAMLDSEWPTCKRALVRWLDPSNFEPDGTQRRTLAAIRATESREGSLPSISPDRGVRNPQ